MSGYESDTCGRSYTIRIRYVWTQIFLYPHKKISEYKNLRIRVDGALGYIVLNPEIHNFFARVVLLKALLGNIVKHSAKHPRGPRGR